jgi:glycosyltransferase involved in cell wall biosynthesis
MRVAICSSFVPFVYGGARFIVDWLAIKLREHGHQVEIIYLPFSEKLDELFPQYITYRMLDLTEKTDRLIAIRPPAYLIPHPNKVIWLIHHYRTFYDLWNLPERPFPDDLKHQAIRKRVMEADEVGFREARHLFTNSKTVSNRLQFFNKMDSEVLYPPLLEPERFSCRKYGDEVVYVCRVEHHKRQHLLVEAFRYVHPSIKLRICGTCTGSYAQNLRQLISRYHLEDRVNFENRWISEEEKREILADALITAYLPLDEDSYGYPSLEASCARKGIITTTDAGGVLELVVDGLNGRIVEPEPEAIAGAINAIHEKRGLAREMGEAAFHRLGEMNIQWDHVVGRLLS